jgi:AcrR family transcriptional regulator
VLGNHVPGADTDTAGRVNRRARQAAETRARLLDAAKSIFEEKGYLSSSVAAIVKRANVSHGTFYHYFHSRDDVFRAIAQQAEDRLQDFATGARDSQPGCSVSERLRQGIGAFLATYQDQAQIMRAIEEVSRHDDELRSLRNRRLRRFIDDMAGWISTMQRHGMADPTLDPILTAAILGSITLRFPEMWLVDGVVDFDVNSAAGHITTIFVNTLGCGRPAEEAVARDHLVRLDADERPHSSALRPTTTTSSTLG